MASNKITTVFDAENKGLKTAVVQGTTEIQKLRKAAARESRSIARSWGNMAQSVGSSLQKISAAGALAFGAATKFSTDFGKAMANVNSIAQQSEAQFKKTTRSVLGLNHEIGTAQSPKLLAEALYDINSAGFSGAEGLKVLKSAAIGADAGQAAAAVVADGLTTELRAFGLEASESGRVLDMMLKTVQRGKVTMEQFSTNIGSIASDSKQANVTQEELHGSIALLTAKTGQASQSFTRFQALVKGLSLPPKEARDAYKDLGLSFGSTAIEANGLVGQLRKMREATKGDDVAFAKLLGGRQEAISAANILLGDDNGASALNEISEAANAAGTTQAAFAEQSKSAAFQFQKLSSSLQAGAIVFGNAIAPAVGWVADKLQTLVTKFNELDPAVKKTIAVGAAVGTVLAGIAGVALTAAPGIAAVVTAMSAPAGVAMIASIKAAGIAIAGFVSGPVATAGAAVAALYLAWRTNLGGIQEKVREWGRSVQDSMSEVATYFGEKYAELKAVTQEAWTAIKPYALAALDIIQDRVVTFGEAIVDTASVAWELFSGAAKVAWEIIKGITDVQMTAIRTVLEAGTAAMNGDWTKAFGILVDGTKKALDRVNELFLRVLEEIGVTILSAGGKMYDAGVNLVRNLREGAAKEFALFKQMVAETMGVSVRQTEIFGEAAERQTRTAFQNMLSHAETFRDQFRSTMDEALEPLRSIGEQVSGSLGGVRSSLGSILSPIGTVAKAFGHKSSSGGGGSGSGGGTGGRATKKGEFDRAAAATYIRQFAHAESNLSGLGGLDDKTLRALHDAIKNAMKEGVDLIVTSTARDSAGHHGSGEAVDFYALGSGVNEANMARVLQQLFAGTGFTSVIDELRQGVLNVTGGTGPHAHATTGVQQQFQGTDGRDAVLYIEKTSLQKVVEDQAKQSAAIDSLIKDFQAQTLDQADLILGMVEESARQTAALTAAVQESQMESMTKSVLGLAGAEGDAFGGTGGAFGTAEDIIAADEAEKERVRALEEAKYQERLRRHEMEMSLGYLEVEEHIRWLDQMAQAEGLTTDQRLQREQAYHQAKRGLEANTFNYIGQLQQGFASSFSQFLNSTLTGQQTFSQGIKQLWRSVFNQIIQMLVQAIIKATILNSLMGGSGFIFGGISGLFSGLFNSGSDNGMGGGGSVVLAHSGERYVTADPLSRYLQGTGDLGAGEALRVLQTGEEVLSRRDARRGSGTASMPSPSSTSSISIGEVHNHGTVDLDQLTKALAWQQYAYRKGG